MAPPKNIGVKMQYQETNEWCWIAVATSINHFYDAASAATQCGSMTVVGQTINGFPANTGACPDAQYLNNNPSVASALANPYTTAALYVLDNYLQSGPNSAYKKTGGVGDPLAINGNCANYPGQGSLPLSLIVSEIAAGRPLAVDIAWNSGGQHTVAIAGEANGQLYICDPINGDSIVQYTNFPSQYYGGASLVTVCLTKEPAVRGSALTSFALSNNATRLYYLDRHGWVNELGWTGSGWLNTNLGEYQGNYPAASGSTLTSFRLSNNDTRLYYLDKDGWVHELGWTGSGWERSDLKATQGSYPAMAGSALTSFGLSNNDTRLYYLDKDGWVHELGWTGSGWERSDLKATQGNYPAVAGSALASFGLSNNDTRLYYLDKDGWVHELGWTGSGWERSDLKATQGSYPAVAGSALTSFRLSNDDTRLYYLDKDGWVHELGWTGSGWERSDLKATQGSYPAVAGSALTSFGLSNNDTRLYYLGKGGWVHELGWTGSGWERSDLKATQVAVAAVTGSALTGFAESNNYTRLYYLDVNGGVAELGWTGSSWEYSRVG